MNKRHVLRAIKKEIKSHKCRSAWDRGVTMYALDLFSELEERITNGWFTDLDSPILTKASLLNGAESWKEYSWGGCSLIYDSDIAERLCAPWELKRTDHGNKRPNSREEWLDVQARALYQASHMVMRAYRKAVK